MEIGANRQKKVEYLIFDTLSLVGEVGGTLGLFVGFSFYDFIAMIIDFFFERMKSGKRSQLEPTVTLISVISDTK